MAERSRRKPLRHQVRDWVLEILAKGNYQPGDQIPTEQELVNMLDVSRATLREGLQLLEQERIILTKHGSGRYLVSTPREIAIDVARLSSVTELLKMHALRTRSVTLELDEKTPEPSIAGYLNLEADKHVLSLERIRYAEDIPIIYSVDVFPVSLLSYDWQPADFGGSLFELLEQRCGVQISMSRSNIRAVTMKPELAERVNTDSCTPWILFDQIHYDVSGKPIIYSQDYHRGDVITFHVMRHRD
jgi:GntR family transcriptional regulator